MEKQSTMMLNVIAIAIVLILAIGLIGIDVNSKYDNLNNDTTNDSTNNTNEPLDDKIIAKEVNGNYLLYQEGENLILSDLNTKELIKNIQLSVNYSSYDIVIDENNKAIGIIYSDDKNNGYYNIENDEILYANKYDKLDIDRFSSINDVITLIGKTKIQENLYKKALLDTNQEKELIVEEINPDNQNYSIVKLEEGNYYLSGHGSPTSHNPWVYDIYSNDLKKIASNIDNTYFHFDLDGYLYVYQNNGISKYDVNGNKLYSKNLGEIKEIAYNYGIKVKDSNLILVNINDGTETKLLDWKDGYYYHQTLTYKKDGRITITVGYSEEHYDFEAATITFDLKTLKVDVKETVIAGY